MKIRELLKSPLIQILLISTFLFVIFFPRFYTSTDEREYIENAYLITENRLVKNDAVCHFDNVYCGYFNGAGYISKYNLGLSFLFIPFVLINWQLTIVFTFAVYLIGVWIFSKLLKRHGLSQKFLYLYAFFPILVYYSRKPMGEIFSNTIVLAIYYLLFEKISENTKYKSLLYVFSGALSGILVLIRYTNILIVLIFLVYLFYLQYKEKINSKLIAKNFANILIGAAPFIIAFLWINKTLYGGFFTSGYSLSHEEFLVLPDLIPKQLIIYILLLNLIYPGMLVISLLSKIKHRWMILFLITVFTIFYMGFPGYNFTSGILDFIFGLRFFVPIISLLLLIYFDGLNQVLSEGKYLKRFSKYFKYLFIIISTILILSAAAISYSYLNRTIELKNESDEIYKKIEEGGVFDGNIENRILLNEGFKNGKRWVRITDK